jgi:hypothetical protein
LSLQSDYLVVAAELRMRGAAAVERGGATVVSQELTDEMCATRQLQNLSDSKLLVDYSAHQFNPVPLLLNQSTARGSYRQRLKIRQYTATNDAPEFDLKLKGI